VRSSPRASAKITALFPRRLTLSKYCIEDCACAYRKAKVELAFHSVGRAGDSVDDSVGMSAMKFYPD
jgi:hypothetical protein